MARLFILEGLDPQRLIWNIDANVGLNCPNRRDDLDLVQLGFSAMAKNSALPPDQRAIYAAVNPGAAFSGTVGDPLIMAIQTLQKRLGGIADNHVSVLKGGTGAISPSRGLSSANVYLIRVLNNNLFDFAARDWPHLNRLQNCPPALSGVATKALKL